MYWMYVDREEAYLYERSALNVSPLTLNLKPMGQPYTRMQSNLDVFSLDAFAILACWTKEGKMSTDTKSVLAQLPGIKPANAERIARLNRAMQVELVEKFKQRERDKQQRSVALARSLQVR